MSDIAIKAENISKLYHIGMNKSVSFRESISNTFSNLVGNKKVSEDGSEFWALNDVSFEIKTGESVGIIGKNGAGKSTLLKVLSRITEPTNGKVTLNGRVASLLEVGTGFHPELTGRENIFLNGSILGMTRKEIIRKFDEIVNFSGIEKFIDTPVKRYSSGMYVRLAFSVAAHLEPEILIIDEVLAVGDAEFQKKCLNKMDEVTGQGRTVIFVSHNMGAISSLCRKAILMSNGKMVFHDDVSKVIDKYLFSDSISGTYKSKSDGPVFFSEIDITGNETKLGSSILFTESFCINFTIANRDQLQNFVIGFAILDSSNNKIFTVHHKIELGVSTEYSGKCEIKGTFLLPGNYTIDAALFIPGMELYEYLSNVCMLTIIDNGNPLYYDKNNGVIFYSPEWEISGN